VRLNLKGNEMIKKLIAMRVEKLLNDLEAIADKHSERVVDATNEINPMNKAILTSIPPNEMKRIMSIREQLSVMQGIFSE